MLFYFLPLLILLGGFRASPVLLVSALFVFLLASNFMGLVPFVFGLSTFIPICVGTALCFWGGLFLSGWCFSPKKAAANLFFLGAPMGLAFFLVLVESVSLLIRPVTLTVRLVANMAAGHIILCLLPKDFLVYYSAFEFFVCCVQAYIFCLLVSLYSSEHCF